MPKISQRTLLLTELDEPHTAYRERGGRTIEENVNRQTFETLQVLQTKALQKLAFERRHGCRNYKRGSLEMARMITSVRMYNIPAGDNGTC